MFLISSALKPVLLLFVALYIPLYLQFHVFQQKAVNYLHYGGKNIKPITEYGTHHHNMEDQYKKVRK